MLLKKRQVTKRCHWVPQAYLRDFAGDPSHSKIWRLSKKSGDPELKPIKNVTVRHHLYVHRAAATQERDDFFETKLSQLEQWFGDPIWRALQTNLLDLGSKELRMIVSLVVAVMYLRTPIHYENLKEFHRKMVSEVQSLGRAPTSFVYGDRERKIDPESWPAYRDASEDDLKRMWISQMNEAAEYAGILVGMRWSMLLADKPTFITSDNPVTVIHPSLKFCGLANPETLILFPVNPQRVLMLDHHHEQPANRYYPLQDNGAAQNLLIWRNAIEYMFSNQHPDITCRAILAEADLVGGF